MTYDPQDIVTCPRCGKQDELEQFDCIGACNDNVFCTQCHCEFDPVDGITHECNLTADEAAKNRERGIHCPGRDQ